MIYLWFKNDELVVFVVSEIELKQTTMIVVVIIIEVGRIPLVIDWRQEWFG